MESRYKGSDAKPSSTLFIALVLAMLLGPLLGLLLKGWITL